MTADLVLEGLCFDYPEMPMRFDLRVSAGALVALLGPSGGGKSTLLSLIAGLEAPSAGRILVGGQDIGALAPARRPLTLLFQEHNLFPHLTAFDNVALGLSPALKLTSEDRRKVEAALAEVGLEGLSRRKPGQLSGGQRQRVALARCLVRERPLLLLDEPFSALDPALRREMLALLSGLRARLGATILMVTHDPEDARQIADRIAFVAEGKVLLEGPSAEVLTSREPPALAAYLGR